MRQVDERETQRRALELESFKRDIDLRDFASSIGYRQVQRSDAYWRGARSPEDEIIITRKPDGVWVYVDPRNVSAPKRTLSSRESAGDQGTIVDLVQRERPDLARNFGELRKELRRIGGSMRPNGSGEAATAKPVQRRSPADLGADVGRARFDGTSDYLSLRGLRPETLSSPRFRKAFGVRPSGETIFPHRDTEGFTGYERKHFGRTGFATGGARSLWCSSSFQRDTVLVVCETAIDCLSFHQLQPREDARYMSTGGGVSHAQKLLLQKAFARLPATGSVVIATDNDGHHLAAFLKARAGFEELGRLREGNETELQIFGREQADDRFAFITLPSGREFACKRLAADEWSHIRGLQQLASGTFDRFAGEKSDLPEFLSLQSVALGPRERLPTIPGRRMAAQIEAIVKGTRPTLTVERPLPPVGFNDWNDVVQSRERQFIESLTAQRRTHSRRH